MTYEGLIKRLAKVLEKDADQLRKKEAQQEKIAFKRTSVLSLAGLVLAGLATQADNAFNLTKNNGWLAAEALFGLLNVATVNAAEKSWQHVIRDEELKDEAGLFEIGCAILAATNFPLAIPKQSTETPLSLLPSFKTYDPTNRAAATLTFSKRPAIEKHANIKIGHTFTRKGPR